MTSTGYDVVVVGGGAAGLSAALVLGRARRRVIVGDVGAPRDAPAAHTQGFLPRDGMPPADFLAAGRIEVDRRPSTKVPHRLFPDLTHVSLIESANGATAASDAIVAVVTSVPSGTTLDGSTMSQR